MAVACFVKLLGTVFLGSPRSGQAASAYDPQASMLVPMVVLAAGCAGLGLFPMAAVPVLEKAVHSWAAMADPKAGSLATLAPLDTISLLGLTLVALAAAVALPLKMLLRGKTVTRAGTWDCGYARPTARMQYTGSSFVQTIVHLFRFIVLPGYRRPTLRGPFPQRDRFSSTVLDLVLDRIVIPLFQVSGRGFSTLRIMQQGQTHLYLIYIVAIVFILLLWGSL